MRYLIIFTLLFTISCTKQVLEGPPLQYSFMPKYFDLDSIGKNLPSDPNTVVDSGLQDYKSIPIYSGVFINDNDTIILPHGVLISEKKAAKYIFYEAEYDRLNVELKYSKSLTKQYYEKSLAAEEIYQKEIIRLRNEARRTWFEKNGPYIGFAAGILSAVLTEIAVIKLAD